MADRCGEPKTHEIEFAKQLVCSLLQRQTEPTDELYAISLIRWDYPINEEYIVLNRAGDQWSLFAKAGTLDYSGHFNYGDEFARIGINTRETWAQHFSPKLGEDFRAYLSEKKWTSILSDPEIILHGEWTPVESPADEPQGKASCVDGSQLPIYRQ